MSYRTTRSFARESVEERAHAVVETLRQQIPLIEKGLRSALAIHQRATPEGKAATWGLRLLEDAGAAIVGFILCRLCSGGL